MPLVIHPFPDIRYTIPFITSRAMSMTFTFLPFSLIPSSLTIYKGGHLTFTMLLAIHKLTHIFPRRVKALTLPKRAMAAHQPVAPFTGIRKASSLG